MRTQIEWATEIQGLVRGDELERAADQLVLVFGPTQPEVRNRGILLKARLSALGKREHAGLVSASDAGIERNRVREAILNLLSDAQAAIVAPKVLSDFHVEDVRPQSGEEHVKSRTAPPAIDDGVEWDFFLAYASADRDIAEAAAIVLSNIGRVFIDIECIRPGERWTEVIRNAQNAASSTVLIVTTNTPSAWFTESEYLRAVELRRGRSHIIVPVIYGDDVRLPYGLEQVQAVRVHDLHELNSLAEALAYIVQRGK